MRSPYFDSHPAARGARSARSRPVRVLHLEVAMVVDVGDATKLDRSLLEKVEFGVA
jgi:hypothetical protein